MSEELDIVRDLRIYLSPDELRDAKLASDALSAGKFVGVAPSQELTALLNDRAFMEEPLDLSGIDGVDPDHAAACHEDYLEYLYKVMGYEGTAKVEGPPSVASNDRPADWRH